MVLPKVYDNGEYAVFEAWHGNIRFQVIRLKDEQEPDMLYVYDYSIGGDFEIAKKVLEKVADWSTL